MVKARNQPSKVEKLPRVVREELDALRTRQGWTIEQLLDWLRAQGHDNISRSGLGNYCRNLYLDTEAAADKINRAGVIAKALIERFGDRPDNELARANIQMLHGQVFNMILEEDSAFDEEGNPLPGDSLKLVRLTKAVQQLLSAEKMNAERVAQIRKIAREEAQQEAAAAVDAVATRTERGLTKDTIDAIKREILKAG